MRNIFLAWMLPLSVMAYGNGPYPVPGGGSSGGGVTNGTGYYTTPFSNNVFMLFGTGTAYDDTYTNAGASITNLATQYAAGTLSFRGILHSNWITGGVSSQYYVISNNVGSIAFAAWSSPDLTKCTITPWFGYVATPGAYFAYGTNMAATITVGLTATGATLDSVTITHGTFDGGTNNSWAIRGGGLGINSVNVNALVPVLIATNQSLGNAYLSTFWWGDSIMAGYNSGVPGISGGSPFGYSSYDYFKQQATADYLKAGFKSYNYASSFSENAQSGYTLHYWLNTADGSAGNEVWQAKINDFKEGLFTAAFPTPDALAFYETTNNAAKHVANGSAVILETCLNWEPAASYLSSAGTWTNLYKYYAAVTNLGNYIGTNSSGYVITTNSFTYNQYQTFIYNYNAALVSYCQKYAHLASVTGMNTNMGLVRMDNYVANGSLIPTITNTESLHPAFPIQYDLGVRTYRSFFYRENDYTPPTKPWNSTVLSQSFGDTNLLFEVINGTNITESLP